MLRNSNFLLKIAFCSHFSGSPNLTDFELAIWACDFFFRKCSSICLFIQPSPSLLLLFFFLVLVSPCLSRNVG